MPKFIVKSDFANNFDPPLKVEGAKHERHIHKGAVIVIGDPKVEFEDMGDRDKDRELCLRLIAAERIVEESDEKAVKKIRREVEDEKQRDTNTASMTATSLKADNFKASVAAEVDKALVAAGVKKAA